MKKIILLLAIFITTSLFGKNVLILNAYRQSFVWTASETQGILETIQKSKLDIKYYIEDMDTKVFRPNPQREKNLLNYYMNKYKDIKFDAIIVTDDNAINFVRKYKNKKIFKDAKVFFCGINNLNLSSKLDKNIYAGIFEQKDPLANYHIAKKINKDLKTIYIVTDDTVTSKKVVAQYLDALTGVKEKVVVIKNKDFNKIKIALKNYEKDSVMFLIVFSSFFDGKTKLSSTKVIQDISAIYNNPIIIHSNPFIDTPKSNIIGGKCTDGYTHGYIAASKMLEYFHGKDLKDIGFEFDSGNKYYLNIKNLAKFNITPKKLGIKDFIPVNNKLSFYEKYQEYIKMFVIVIILIFIFIVVIVVKNKRLKEAAQTFWNIFNNSTELNLLTSQGKILRVNEYGMKLLGYSIEDKVIGKDISEFIQPEDLPKVHQAMQKEKSAPYEINILAKDGHYKTFLNTSISIKLNGKTIRFSSLADISEVKQKDQLLFEQSKLASMGEMIGNIAHQWRQPLSVITSAATGILLKKNFGMLSDKFLEEACDSIEKNAQYLSKTIDDFRNFIKGDRVKTKFFFQDNIDSFIQLIEASAKANSIIIVTNIDEIEYEGYENELLQCYINIFNNAKDIFKEKELEIAEKYFFIDCYKEDNHVILTFKDNAGGIPEDILPKIFEPYFTTKHKSKGTGLGLHMTYRLIVDGMDGKITAQNDEYIYKDIKYKGALFKITLPI